MNDKRQKTSLQQTLLTFAAEGRDESPDGRMEGIASEVADSESQSPTKTDKLMDRICGPLNFNAAIDKVVANDGAPGVDGMTVNELGKYLERHRPRIIKELLSGTFKPQPVKRVEIPKPDGGVRKLGIPTTVDRVVQQAILQVLGPLWDATFLDSSFGFRPGRSAHDAVAQAQRFLVEGYTWVVDMDLEKFFDRVNHDVLMGRVALRIEDKRLLKLIRAFLNSGVMIDGLFSGTPQVTPQGGPLSPLLSNLLLDELDRELESRGLRFSRYADDCNVYVQKPARRQTCFAKLDGLVGEEASASSQPGQERRGSALEA